MATNSAIEWTDHTFNPWRGCTKVSEGCAHCYADKQSKRNPGVLGVWGPNGTRVVAAESYWKQPLDWNRYRHEHVCGQEAERVDGGWWCQQHGECAKDEIRRVEFDAAKHSRHRVFCASMADVFEDWQGPMVGPNGTAGVWCENCKEKSGGASPNVCSCGRALRPVSMGDIRGCLFRLIDRTPNLDWLLLTKRPENIARMMPPASEIGSNYKVRGPVGGLRLEVVRPNVWLGVSAENQACLVERWEHLVRIPAAIRFLSCEPLLGHLNFTPVFDHMTKPDWVIVGGESGHGARPMDVAWVRSIVQQCKTAGVPCFVKQLGSSYYGTTSGGQTSRICLDDRKGGNPDEWPDDLRVREFPIPVVRP